MSNKARRSAKAAAPHAAAPSAAVSPCPEEQLGNAAMLQQLEVGPQAEPEGGGFLESVFGAIFGGSDSASDTANGENAAKDVNTAKDTAQGAAVSSGMGAEVDALVAASPALASALQQAQSDGWVIEVGEEGRGTYADRQNKTIVIDGSKSDPNAIARSLAHELGHANDLTESYVGFGDRTREEYVHENTMGQLRGEGQATFMELRVRDELLAAGHDDIGISGTSAPKIELWERYQAGELTEAELIEEIATFFGENERPSTDPDATYFEYYARAYESHWDKHHP